MCALCNYSVIFYSSQSITKSHGNDCSSGLCHRVDIQIRCRQGKYNFLFRLFNILIIHKHAVTCGHKLIIIDVRLDRLFWPLFICFVFCGASCEPCVDWVWVMASAQTVTVKKTRTSINNIRRNSFFLLNHWRFVVFMCLVEILKFNSRTFLNPGFVGFVVGVVDWRWLWDCESRIYLMQEIRSFSLEAPCLELHEPRKASSFSKRFFVNAKMRHNLLLFSFLLLACWNCIQQPIT